MTLWGVGLVALVLSYVINLILLAFAVLLPEKRPNVLFWTIMVLFPPAGYLVWIVGKIVVPVARGCLRDASHVFEEA